MLAFDAKRAFFNRTGLGNFSRNLINALAQHRPDAEMLLCTPKLAGKEAYALNPSGRQRLQTLGLEPFGNLRRVRGLGGILAKSRAALFHGLSNELPFDWKPGKPPSVVTVHDLLFLRYPHTYPFFDRRVYAAKWRHACRAADLVVAVSEQTRRDLVEFLGMKESKLRVVYQSCSPAFYHASKPQAAVPDLFAELGGNAADAVLCDTPEAARLHYKLPREYILYVGSVTERKNLLTLVKAVELLKNRVSVALVVVGKGNAYMAKARRYVEGSGLGGMVHFLGHVPTGHLVRLYGGASLLAHPSVFEGFGIPIIEALQCGLPVVASQGLCFAEAGGEGSLYVPPYNLEALAGAIERVLCDQGLRNHMAAAGLEHAKRFEPRNIARQYWDLYDDLL